MKIKKTTDYLFENDVLEYRSIVKGFTDKNYVEFDKSAHQSDLIRKIDDLLTGKIVNKSENQAAFHPKYRAYEQSAKTPKHLIDAEFYAAEFFNLCWNTAKDKGFDQINIISIGIGGSYEGPKLLLESLNKPFGFSRPGREKINYKFITGSDLSEFEEKTKFLNPENTFFIVSSKSFTTPETLDSLKKAFNWCKNKNHFFAITANPEEPRKHGVENIIFFDNEIGGRYSIWSPITQFHLCGDERSSFIKGGHQADVDLFKNKDYLSFIKRLSFTDIFLNNRGKNVRVILSYLWNLRSLPDYFQQLEMESLGKPANQDSDYDHTGQIIFGGYGPIAQHSYFQLLHQGTQEICADIISSKDDEKSLSVAQAITQSELLANGESDTQLKNEFKVNGNIPVNLFLLNKLDAFNLGYLIATWEHRTFVTATLLDINPFDQFGVNAGKIYTNKYLADSD